MTSSSLFRYELIKNYVALYAEKDADGLVILWERMAVEIVLLLGEGGFNSLFERSVGLTRPGFPWLVISSPLSKNGNRFADLRLRFAEQLPAQASAANTQLLLTFTNLLASLIGEQIAVVILHTAIGNSGTAQKNTKESDDE